MIDFLPTHDACRAYVTKLMTAPDMGMGDFSITTVIDGADAGTVDVEFTYGLGGIHSSVMTCWFTESGNLYGEW
jgi:hypothetical protein